MNVTLVEMIVTRTVQILWGAMNVAVILVSAWIWMDTLAMVGTSFVAFILSVFRVHYSLITVSDVDECSDGSHTCDNHTAVCNNTIGGYLCYCAPGYNGSGFIGECDG